MSVNRQTRRNLEGEEGPEVEAEVGAGGNSQDNSSLEGGADLKVLFLGKGQGALHLQKTLMMRCGVQVILTRTPLNVP